MTGALSLAEIPPAEAEGELASAQVAFRLAVTDLQGEPVEQATPGTDIYLNVYVQDVREGARIPGIFAAYLDVNYPADLLSIVPSSANPRGFDIEFGPHYANGPWGVAKTAGLIDEAGAFQTGFAPLGSAEYLVFRVRFTAGRMTLCNDVFTGIAEDSRHVLLDVLANDQFRGGVAEFTSNPADISPAHDVLTYSPPVVVPDAEAVYGQTTLQVTLPSAGVITSVTQPSCGGQVQISANGLHLLYSPPADFSGTEQFTYTVGGVRTASVTVDVYAVNDAPDAVDDQYELGRNEVLRVDALRGVLQNDHDAEGDPLRALLVEPPQHGSLELQPDGSFVYTPEPDFVGTDRFVYAAQDPWFAQSEAEVVLQVGAPRVGVRLELVDGTGQPVGRVTSGDPLRLRAWVRDLRSDFYPERGVYAAYLDVLFDEMRMAPMLNDQLPLGFEIDFGEAFQEPGAGAVQPEGRVQGVGSQLTDDRPPGDGEQLLFEMPFEAGGASALDDEYTVSFQSVRNVLNVMANDDQFTWNTAFDAVAATEPSAGEVQLWEPRAAVPADEIVWTGTSVDVTNGAAVQIVAVGPASHGGTVTIAADGKQLVYAPAPGFTGTETWTYTVADPSGRKVVATVVVNVMPSWQNLHHPLDVNSDGVVSPIDALLVINYLNSGLPARLEGVPSGPPLRDVNGDGYISPLDALLVINYLQLQAAGAGEGVAVPLRSASAATAAGRPADLSGAYVPLALAGAVGPGERAPQQAVETRRAPGSRPVALESAALESAVFESAVPIDASVASSPDASIAAATLSGDERLRTLEEFLTLLTRTLD